MSIHPFYRTQSSCKLERARLREVHPAARRVAARPKNRRLLLALEANTAALSANIDDAQPLQLTGELLHEINFQA
jgi:hypothetical protein